MNDPFLVLDVPPDADDERVRRAWLAHVRRFPPERDPVRFEAARAAYERISTRRRRLAHALFSTEPPDLETLVALALRAGGGTKGAPSAATRRPSPELVRRLLRESLGESLSENVGAEPAQESDPT